MHQEYAVGWFTLALLNAGLAQVKNNATGKEGMGGGSWFLISLFLGPIATIMIVVYKK